MLSAAPDMAEAQNRSGGAYFDAGHRWSEAQSMYARVDLESGHGCFEIQTTVARLSLRSAAHIRCDAQCRVGGAQLGPIHAVTDIHRSFDRAQSLRGHCLHAIHGMPAPQSSLAPLLARIPYRNRASVLCLGHGFVEIHGFSAEAILRPRHVARAIPRVFSPGSQQLHLSDRCVYTPI